MAENRTLLSAALAVTLASGALRAGQSATEEYKIGVVEIPVVKEKYEKFQALEVLARQMFEEKKKLLEQLKEQIDRQTTQIAIAVQVDRKPRDSEEVALLELELFRLKYEHGRLAKELSSQWNTYELHAVKEILEDLENAVRKLATAEGYALVLKVRTTHDLIDQAQDMRELRLLFASTPELYYDEGINLTNEVLKQLNKEFKDQHQKTEEWINKKRLEIEKLIEESKKAKTEKKEPPPEKLPAPKPPEKTPEKAGDKAETEKKPAPK